MAAQTMSRRKTAPQKTQDEKRFRVTEAMLARASAPRRVSRSRPFEMASRHHPPGVRGQTARDAVIAQDESISETLAWASGFPGVGISGQRFLGYPVLSELAQLPEYRRLAETIASEMTREWIEFKSTGDDDKTDKLKVLVGAVRYYKLQEHFCRIATHDALFGCGHLYVDTGDGDRPQELLTSIGNGRDKISNAKIGKGKLKAFRPVEPIWVYPGTYNAFDPLSENWYRPETWFVMAKQVHRTRLLTIVAREVPDILKPVYFFGGISLTQLVQPYVEKFRRDAMSISSLIEAFSIMVLSTNLGASLQLDGDEIFKRADLFTRMRDNLGLMLIDAQAEEKLENVSAPLGSLDRLQAQSQEHICSASGQPLIKVTGLTPTGLNASSEGEIRSFYDHVHASQEYIFREPLTNCIGLIQLSEFGEIDPEITFDFKPLWQLDEAAKAAVQKTKADVHDIYLTAGVISAEEARTAIASDVESPYQGLDLDPESVPEQGIERIDDPNDPLSERVDRIAESQGGVTSGI